MERKFYVYESTENDPKGYYLGLFTCKETPQVAQHYALEIADSEFEFYVVVGSYYKAGEIAEYYMVPMGKFDPPQITRAEVNSVAPA